MERRYYFLITIFIILAIIFIVPYFIIFNYEFSHNHSVWGEFGSFIGGVLTPIVGLIAFIGLLLNLELTKKQFKKQSEDNTFFNMLRLHNNKVESMSVENDRNSVRKIGFLAFKHYVTEFNKIYNEKIIGVARRHIAYEPQKLNYNDYNFLWSKYTKFFHKEEKIFVGKSDQIAKIVSLFEQTPNKDRLDKQKWLVGHNDDLTPSDKEALISIGQGVVEEETPEKRLSMFQWIYDFFYDDHGHMLDHYFRNIYYILKFIDQSGQALEYSDIFRVQFSRYELALLYYNALSKMSEIHYVQLLIKYDILGGLYWFDICYYLKEDERMSDLNAKLSILK